LPFENVLVFSFSYHTLDIHFSFIVLLHFCNKFLVIYSGYGQQASAGDADDSNNEANNSEVAVSSQTASVANTHDSGLPNSSCGTSASSLPQRPFEGLGTSSSSSLSFQQPLSTGCTRSHSDEDVSIDDHSHKRARHDSGTQSLDEDTQPVNLLVINVQQIYKCGS
jgi:hypothetical protein